MQELSLEFGWFPMYIIQGIDQNTPHRFSIAIFLRIEQFQPVHLQVPCEPWIFIPKTLERTPQVAPVRL